MAAVELQGRVPEPSAPPPSNRVSQETMEEASLKALLDRNAKKKGVAVAYASPRPRRRIRGKRSFADVYGGIAMKTTGKKMNKRRSSSAAKPAPKPKLDLRGMSFAHKVKAMLKRQGSKDVLSKYKPPKIVVSDTDKRVSRNTFASRYWGKAKTAAKEVPLEAEEEAVVRRIAYCDAADAHERALLKK